eukprot:249365-Pyramimonas_sp.AAC.1
MAAAVELGSKEEGRVLCRQRYRQGVMFVESSGRSLVMKPSEGGMMGGPFIVVNCVESFKPPVFSVELLALAK